MSDLAIVGRSSSHFTRVARVFALELGVPHDFRPILDMTSLEADTYAGNPALKMPVLVLPEGPLFGTENICRELARRSPEGSRAVLRGQVPDRLVANAEELALHAMSADVLLVLAAIAGDGQASPKVRAGLENSLRFLDENLEAVLSALPPARLVSFFEVATFSLVMHLRFRKLADIGDHGRLAAFAARFSGRESARCTEFRFDSV